MHHFFGKRIVNGGSYFPYLLFLSIGQGSEKGEEEGRVPFVSEIIREEGGASRKYH